jgi:hypothetical protein
MLASTFKTATQFRSQSPISNDQLRQIAPSIFAANAHESRSRRYAYIPTSTVLDGLRKEGFEPFFVAQSCSRVEGKRDFTKHLLRLRRVGMDNGKSEAHELVLINSHDGSSSYQLLSGIIRFICMNGMVCGEMFGEVRVQHSGDVVDRVIEASYEVLGQSKQIAGSVDEMKAVQLTVPEQELFAATALTLRYDAEKPAPVTVDQVLTPRRAEDAGADIWRTFNRVQEGVVRGGLSGTSAKGRRAQTRQVEGIDQNTKLNRALWMLAEGMKKLKGAA